MNSLNFEFEAPIRKISETVKGVFISGVLMRTGTSLNNRRYDIPVLSEIARDSVGKPLVYGVTKKLTASGIIKNVHDESRTVGRILKTFVFKKLGLVKFKGIIEDPEIAEKIHKGYGVSIGGEATDFDVQETFGKKILRILHMIVTHIAIIPPSVRVGIKGSQVEDVEPISECMSFFSNDRYLSDDDITAIVEALHRSGEI